MRKRNSKKALALLVSLVLLVTVAVGATLAYLIDIEGPIDNRFTPSVVTVKIDETFNGNTKSNVSIENTGDTAAYIRAAVIVTWQDANGNVYGIAPVAGTDYEITFDTQSGWVAHTDGYYYWTKPVDAGKTTGVLITEAKPLKAAPAEGYSLCIEIIASGIQSDGTKEGTQAVVDAWGPFPSAG